MKKLSMKQLVPLVAVFMALTACKKKEAEHAANTRPAVNTQSAVAESNPRPKTDSVPTEPVAVRPTEEFFEDFSSATTDLPQGWTRIERVLPTKINREGGKPYLGTSLNQRCGCQLPLMPLTGDFYIEFSMTAAPEKGAEPSKLEALLEGKSGVKPMAMMVVENAQGFECTLTGVEEPSNSVSMAGPKPHKVRLERQSGKFSVLVDGQEMLEKAAGAAQNYTGMKLFLSNSAVKVYSVKMGPM